MKIIACTCFNYDTFYPIEEFNLDKSDERQRGADIIFEGEIISFKKNKNKVHIELFFKIHKKYKGIINIGDTIVIKTEEAASCGLDFKESPHWIIFASVYENSFISSSCTRSLNNTDVAYYRYKDFLDVITKRTEGTHKFYRDKDKLNLELQFKFVNNELEGYWELKNYEGITLESGYYNNGYKIGAWKTVKIFRGFPTKNIVIFYIEYVDNKIRNFVRIEQLFDVEKNEMIFEKVENIRGEMTLEKNKEN